MRQELACSLSGASVTSTLCHKNRVSIYFPVSLTGANIGGFLGGTIVLPVPWKKAARGAGREMGRSGGREVAVAAAQVEAGQELNAAVGMERGRGQVSRWSTEHSKWEETQLLQVILRAEAGHF